MGKLILNDSLNVRIESESFGVISTQSHNDIGVVGVAVACGENSSANDDFVMSG